MPSPGKRIELDFSLKSVNVMENFITLSIPGNFHLMRKDRGFWSSSTHWQAPLSLYGWENYRSPIGDPGKLAQLPACNNPFNPGVEKRQPQPHYKSIVHASDSFIATQNRLSTLVFYFAFFWNSCKTCYPMSLEYMTNVNDPSYGHNY